MFKKKNYIKVRGIGVINCTPYINVSDANMICEVAEGLPFVDVGDADTAKQEYAPEYVEYSFWTALLSVVTDYDFANRDVWFDLHETRLINKLLKYYAPYIDEIYYGVIERINNKANLLKPLNDEALFNGVAKSLDGVDINDVLNFANTISQMDGHEIVKAALDTSAP